MRRRVARRRSRGEPPSRVDAGGSVSQAVRVTKLTFGSPRRAPVSHGSGALPSASLVIFATVAMGGGSPPPEPPCARARAPANAASVSSAARYTPQPASPTQRSLLHSFGCKTAPSITAIENVSPPADLARRLPPAPPASLPSTLQQPSPTQRPTTPSVSNGTNYSAAPVATRRSQGFSGGSWELPRAPWNFPRLPGAS